MYAAVGMSHATPEIMKRLVGDQSAKKRFPINRATAGRSDAASSEGCVAVECVSIAAAS
jgi:hypothetical protein